MTAGGHSLDCVQACLHRIGADLERHARGPVIVIGSAAACLAGARVDVADLDLLTDACGAQELEQFWSKYRVDDFTPGDSDRFRSRYARYGFGGLPVEVMGDLDVCVDGAWNRLIIRDTVAIPGQGATPVMPTVAEQLRVLKLFDRPKDRLRAQRLRHLASLSGSRRTISGISGRLYGYR